MVFDFDRTELGRLPFESIVSLAESRSPLTRADLAHHLRESLSVVNRSFDPAADYFFRVHRLPELCYWMRDDLLIRWQAARLDYLRRNGGLHPECRPLTANASLMELAGLMAEVGQAAAEIQAGAGDGHFDLDEARRIKRRVQDVVGQAFAILAGIEGIIANLATTENAHA